MKRLPKAERRIITVPGGYMRIGKLPRGEERYGHDFDKAVMAVVYGHLAYHKPIADDAGGDRLTITHVPSGRRLIYARTETEARALIRKLLAVNVDWSVSDVRKFRRKATKEAILRALDLPVSLRR